MIKKSSFFADFKKNILKEKQSIRELKAMFDNLHNARGAEERYMIISQINLLRDTLKEISGSIIKDLEGNTPHKPLIAPKKSKKMLPPLEKLPNLNDLPSKERIIPHSSKKSIITDLEKETLKRLKGKEKKLVKKKVTKPNKYIHFSNKLFSKTSNKLVKKPFFHTIARDLIKAKLQLTPMSYISIILLTTVLSVVAGVFIFLFFLFFNVGSELPIITRVAEDVGTRFFKVFWILFGVPIGTFLLMYFYPSLEKKSAQIRIDQELPFATIHMSAISGSMVEPSKIFQIIVATKEYPTLEKELIRLMNEINIYGHDLSTSLRNVAFNSPSSKLADLLNGLATTIRSGGDLPEFFDKRAQSLLFEHRLEREKEIKSSETFMDIYISVVIAAPMILMLLLIMMSVSGLGWLSPSIITLVMVLGVSIANVIFLAFLRIKGGSY